MRILLDTNILVRAAVSPQGPAGEILRLIVAFDEHVLLMPAYVVSEVIDVLRRDRIQARWPLTSEDIRQFCEVLTENSEEIAPQSFPILIRDPKDQAVIEAALAGRADILCTLDSHFYQDEVRRFCRSRDIKIIKDTELLILLRQRDEG